MKLARLKECAGIASILWHKFLTWLGPFGVAIAGIFLLLAGFFANPEKPSIALVILGGLMILSSFDMSAARAKAERDEHWAKFIWSLLGDSNEKTFTVMHKFPSIRPELDAIIAEEVAKAMEARRAETLGSVHDSAVAKPFAQKEAS